jgi:cholesterol 25-hydroxylase
LQASYFETIWTVGLYIAFEHHYVSLATNDQPRPPLPERIDQRPGQSHLWRNGTVRVRKLQGRLTDLVTYVAPLLMLDLTLIKKFKGVSWQAMVSSGGYDPTLLTSTVPLNVSNSFSSKSLPANIATTHFLAPSVHNFTLASPLQLWRALPQQPPSARRLLIELAVSLILYDAVFFLVHLLLHKVPYLYRRVHATHHDHKEIHAQVTNDLDLGERLLLVLTANFSLQIIGAHVLTRTLFVPCFVLFLVQNHCGLDVLSYDKILPKGWGGE